MLRTPIFGCRGKPFLLPKTGRGMRRSLICEGLLMHLALLHCGAPFPCLYRLCWISWRTLVDCVYSPESRMGRVGVAAPAAFSIVMPKALAGTPLGRRGSTSEA